MKPRVTLVSDIIAELQKVKDTHGDIPCAVEGKAYCWVDVSNWFYDGGFIYPSGEKNSEGGIEYLSSRVYTPKGSHKRDTASEMFCEIKAVGGPNADDTVNGDFIRRLFPEIYAFHDEWEDEERKIFEGQIVRYEYLKEKERKLGDKTFTVPMKAYLRDGTFALGASRASAKERLIKKYKKIMDFRSRRFR